MCEAQHREIYTETRNESGKTEVRIYKCEAQGTIKKEKKNTWRNKNAMNPKRCENLTVKQDNNKKRYMHLVDGQTDDQDCYFIPPFAVTQNEKWKRNKKEQKTTKKRRNEKLISVLWHSEKVQVNIHRIRWPLKKESL